MTFSIYERTISIVQPFPSFPDQISLHGFTPVEGTVAKIRTGRRKKRKERYFITKKLLTNSYIAHELNNTKSHSCKENSYHRIYEYIASFFHFLIVTRRKHHLNSSPSHPDHSKNWCNTNRIRNHIREKYDRISLIRCRRSQNITWRFKIISKNRERQGKSKNERNNLIHERKLRVNIHDIEHHAHKPIRKKGNNHRNNIPLDNRFRFACFFWITTGENIIKSSDH